MWLFRKISAQKAVQSTALQQNPLFPTDTKLVSLHLTSPFNSSVLPPNPQYRPKMCSAHSLIPISPLHQYQCFCRRHTGLETKFYDKSLLFLISYFHRVLILVYVLLSISLHTSHRAFEDGPDRGFRNVGKTQSDAGEIPKKTCTKISVNFHYP
jgi:hypothetical protein